MNYSTNIEFDEETGEYFITIPYELAFELQWEVGDDINWTIEGDSIILSKKNKEEEKE